MKKLISVLIVALALGSLAFAADKPQALTPYVDKGSLLVNAGVGWGGISGGAELTFYRIDIGGLIPVTFGAAARAMIDPGIFYSGYTRFGVGGFATVHFGFKGLSLPSGLSWVSDCDTYAGLGVGLAAASYTGLTINPGFGISTFEGVSYYLNDKLALNGEYGYLGQTSYSGFGNYYASFGVIFKL